MKGSLVSLGKTIGTKLTSATPPLDELYPYPQLLSRHRSPRLPGLQDSCPPVSLLTATAWLKLKDPPALTHKRWIKGKRHHSPAQSPRPDLIYSFLVFVFSLLFLRKGI